MTSVTHGACPRKTAPTFETKRLRLRAFRAGDLKALHALYGDADNLRYWGVDPSPARSTRRGAMMRWHIAYHPAAVRAVGGRGEKGQAR